MTNNPLDDTFLPMTSIASGQGEEVLPDIYSYTVQIVNVAFIGAPEEKNSWVLIDAGMPRSADKIAEAAEERFGAGCRPKAILLTHGHFDHIGACAELAEKWDVPMYAHERELPFITGKEQYPYPDPTVEGGLVAKLSKFFPNEPIDLGPRAKPLPSDGSVPFLPGWRWLHTPGHTAGHVSFYRDEDRSLIAGDAFITVRQDALWKVLAQKQEISGPPRYFTPDWNASKHSVHKLAALKPRHAVTGHGPPVSGETLSAGLNQLASHFDEEAVPDHGKYVDDASE